VSFFHEGQHRLYIGGRALLLDDEQREVASEWALRHIRENPAYAWILGRYVEADRPNLNKQYFSLGDLRIKSATLNNAPLNVNHSMRNVVGAFVAHEMVYPTDAGQNPYIEALASVWKYYFPHEYAEIRKAHEEGTLFFSMEAVPRAISSIGGSDDAREYPYMGRRHASYPKEINERTCEAIWMKDPHFVGGAAIIPPAKPGWTGADARQIAEFINERWEVAERIYEQVALEAPDLEPKEWERLMGYLIQAWYLDPAEEQAREFDSNRRKKLAQQGLALPDGSFPIVNVQDLKNAIQAIGRAKDKAAARRHIIKRAKALGRTDLIPDDWG